MSLFERFIRWILKIIKRIYKVEETKEKNIATQLRESIMVNMDLYLNLVKELGQESKY